MSIDELRELFDVDGGIGKYIPETYQPTEFTLVVSIDMDGVLCEFLSVVEELNKYLVQLEEMRGFGIKMPEPPDKETMEGLLSWCNKMVDMVNQREGNIEASIKEITKTFDKLKKSVNSPAWLEEQYYRWLPPMQNMCDAVKMLTKVPQIVDEHGIAYNLVVKVCSCSPSEKATLDKYIWLAQNLPEINNIIIVPYDENNSGRNKAIALGLPVIDPSLPEPSPELVNHRSKTMFVHLDDCTKVIKDMQRYGVSCIKCRNGINDTHKSFIGPRLDILDTPSNILKNMVKIFSQIATKEAERRFGVKSVEKTNEKVDEAPMLPHSEIEPILSAEEIPNKPFGDDGER